MRNSFKKILMIGASTLALATPALAQSTGTQQVESVVVSAQLPSINGLMNASPISKEQSTITKDFLNTVLPAGQTVFQALNYMPGVNFTNNDPYGTSGGDIRIHGQDGNHISLTLDGMPLNDTGNYAVYTNQMIDPEVIDRVSVNQGSTDVDSPTAAATGGVIAIKSDNPHDVFGAELVLSRGTDNDQRYFARIDSGEIGPWGTEGYLTYSYQSNDKFKGPGYERKIETNFKIRQDIEDGRGWLSLAGHWNANRNTSYYAFDYAPNTTGFTAALASQTDLIKNPNGSGYVQNPNPGAIPTSLGGTNTNFDSVGWDRDFRQNCPRATPVTGAADNTQTTCSFWFKPRVNPSDTGNLRFQSLYNLTDALTVTADANFQYVMATGGSTFFTFKENGGQLIGNTAIAGPATTTAALGCIPGRGCDLNGDGDALDTVGLYQPSVTQTHRYGTNVSLIYKLDENNTFDIAYTGDFGFHRQTGQAVFVDPVNGPYQPFPMQDPSKLVKSADGADLRFRDRHSEADMNQLGFDYEGRYLEDSLRASIGFRLPFLERDLNNSCYIQAGSSTAYCTTEQPTKNNTDGTVSFASSATHYAPPGTTVRNYNRFLPHLGLTYMPFGDEHQFFASYTQELAAPRTDNLYQSVCTQTGPGNTCLAYSNFTNTRPETSTTYQGGYRFLTDDLQLAAILWNTQVKNRIVSSFDQITNTYFDHNISGINFWGVDLEGNWRWDDFTFYANASYTRARITGNIPVGGGFAPTLNKQLSETPKFSTVGRITYRLLDSVQIGASAKYVSKRYQSEDNNAFVPDYTTFNADINWDLDSVGFPGSSLRFNADNLFNRHYFGSVGTQTCWVPNGSFNGCTSYPTAYVGAPQTFQVTLTARY